MTSTQRRAVLRAAIPLSVGLLAGSLPRARGQSAAKLIRGAGATFPAPLPAVDRGVRGRPSPEVDRRL